jgi:hypothetical protein
MQSPAHPAPLQLFGSYGRDRIALPDSATRLSGAPPSRERPLYGALFRTPGGSRSDIQARTPGSVKALLRLYKALLRLYEGSIRLF